MFLCFASAITDDKVIQGVALFGTDDRVSFAWINHLLIFQETGWPF